MKRLLAPLLILGALSAITHATAPAAPLTPVRIATLPPETQPAWRAYIEHAEAAARLNQTALDAELTAQKLPAATRTPDGGDLRLHAKFGDPWYGSAEAAALTDAILSYQTPTGGWSKHTAYNNGPRKPGTQWSSQYAPGQNPHYLATFDNGATTQEMRHLAYVWHATKRQDCKTAFLKALDFILAAQYPNGGWPQVYPIEGGYHDNITYNDDSMTHILEVLADIANGEPYCAFVEKTAREKAAAALAAGIRCLLHTQYDQAGQKTVWCAQHDPLTLLPAPARKMEPAMLSGAESTRIIAFLMTLQKPPPEVIAAIEAGLAWFEKTKITGLARVTRDGKTTYAPAPDSKEIYWARFYDPVTNAPVFPGRDGIIYNTYAEMAAKNKLGYSYIITFPGSLLNTAQKKWRKQLSQSLAAR